jgi:2-polyprenyl-3-methyl-5-hydroxy-6-metoxy-1,4-benzoquinol methylase
VNFSSKIKFMARDLMYPGLDLHTRNRAMLCRFWKSGPRDVLDAGSGNGYFSWLAYKSGATVVALTFNPEQVGKARDYFLKHRKADPARLAFEQGNLYDLPKEQRTFDEIICYETLEHIRRDAEVAAQFFRILRPGGVLHLCCPNRKHPHHQAEVLDLNETGGHVRAGYTEADYRKLLEPIGFKIELVAGIGPAPVHRADRMLRAIRNRVGDVPALPLLPLGLLALKFARLDPPMPHSLYVKAVKRVKLGNMQAPGSGQN